MSDKLKDKVALITGASSGIGREIAIEFAKEKATVILTARSADRLEETAQHVRSAGGRALTVTADLKDELAIKHLATPPTKTSAK